MKRSSKSNTALRELPSGKSTKSKKVLKKSLKLGFLIPIEEYEGMIKNLENILQEKMLELKKEEESHRILYDRYESLLDKRTSKRELENV